MPKPSCSSPPQRLRHSIAYTSAHPYSRGRSSLLTRPRNRTGAFSSAASVLQAVLVAAAPGDREQQIRGVSALSLAAARMAVSKPLRGTSRLIARRARRRRAKPEVGTGLAEPLGRGERVETLGIDPRRHDGDRQLAAGGVLGLGGRVAAGGDDVASTAQHVAERLLAERQTARHGDLGAVQHDVVRQAQRRSDHAQRHRRVEHHQVGADLLRQRVDPLDHPRVRQQDRLAGAFDVERLCGVELGGALVGAGEHGEGVGWQPTPPLPQQRLDAADLGREVVGDEEVLHGAARSSVSTSGWGSVAGIRWCRFSCCAAHTACARSIGSWCAT
jgi:hypothetical protein